MAVAPSTPSGSERKSPVVGRKSPVRLSGSNTPFKQAIRKSPMSAGGRKTTPSVSKNKEAAPEKRKEDQGKDDATWHDHNEAFDDHSEFCKRMAKTLCFANKLPSTPRPSLPLTMLAVNTFASTARKDTLAFLDVEMAAEIGRNACVSPTALILAIIYLERLSSHNPGYLNSIKPSELFVVSLLVASKFIQDDGEDLGIFNDEWATSASMELKALNRLELEFLCAIDWNINAKGEDFNVVLKRLESKVALHQGLNRGWFTYTEMTNLTSPVSWNTLWPTFYDQCVKVLLAAYVTYATVIATVFTSSILAPHLFLFYKGLITTSLASLQSFQTNCLTEQTGYNMSLPMYFNTDLGINRESDYAIEVDFLDVDTLLQENDTDSDFLHEMHSHYKSFGKLGNPLSSYSNNYRMVDSNNDIRSSNHLKEILRQVSLKEDDGKTDISSFLDRNPTTIDSYINSLLRTMGTCRASCQQFCTKNDDIPFIPCIAM